MALSNYLENALLNHVLGGATYTQPSTVYLALYTAAPSDAGGGTELTGGNNYTRQAITFAAASGGSKANNVEITFPALTGLSSTPITHGAIFDAVSGGNMLFHGAFDSPGTVIDGGDFIIPVGDCVAIMD